jgi:hypothetical protein
MSESLFIEPIKKLVVKMQKRLSELMNSSPDSDSNASLKESNNLDTKTFNKTDVKNQPLGQIPAFIPEISDDLLEIDTVDNNFLSTEEEQVEDTNDLSEFNLEGDNDSLRDLFSMNVKTDPIVLQLLEKHGTLSAEELAKELNEFMQMIKGRE